MFLHYKITTKEYLSGVAGKKLSGRGAGTASGNAGSSSNDADLSLPLQPSCSPSVSRDSALVSLDCGSCPEEQLVATEVASSSRGSQSSRMKRTMPMLPANLDDMTASQLRQVVVSQHKQWMQVVGSPSDVSNERNAAVKNAARRTVRKDSKKVRYWKNKARKQERESKQQIAQLRLQSNPYIENKRRRTSSFRRKLTTYSGYKIALSRNIGHVSCASTLAILDADATDRSSVASQGLI